uniref:Uncharacterized protein n=1 Tax=Entomoneis paludosa TaxID=265537 RepID=A0A7S2YCY6_9STRA
MSSSRRKGIKSFVKRKSVLSNEETSTNDDHATALVARAFSMAQEDSLFPFCPDQSPNATQNFDDSLPPTKGGMLFVNPLTDSGAMMEDSSTMTAVGAQMRIARNQATPQKRNTTPLYCQFRVASSASVRKYLTSLNRSHTFIWSILSNPKDRPARAISTLQLSQNSSTSIKRILKSSAPTENLPHYASHLFLRDEPMFDQPQNISNIIQQHGMILEDYDFLGIAERMDETIVLLSMLLRISLGDVLFLIPNGAGQPTAKPYFHPQDQDPSKCSPLSTSSTNTTNSSMTIFKNNSDEWNEQLRLEMELYQAVNASMDLTIDTVVGRSKFDEQLRTFQQAQRLVQIRCFPHTTFSCKGRQRRPKNETDCLWNDAGCSFDCLDEVAKEIYQVSAVL